MSSSPRGILAYGYDLGGPEGWKLENCDQYGNFEFSWYNRFDQLGSWMGHAELQLLTIVGFTEDNDVPREPGHYQRKREAQEKLRVELVAYGSYDYPNYILAVKPVLTVDDRGAKPVEINLDHQAAHELEKALMALGITPVQQYPKWILACFYG